MLEPIKELFEDEDVLRGTSDDELRKKVFEVAINQADNQHREIQGLIYALYAISVLEQRHIDRIEARNEEANRRATKMTRWTIALAVFSIIVSVVQETDVLNIPKNSSLDVAECAKQAEAVLDDWNDVDGGSGHQTNHVNNELGKCFIYIVDHGDTFYDVVMDAYERKELVGCTISTGSTGYPTSNCYDQNGESLTPEEADEQITNYMND